MEHADSDEVKNHKYSASYSELRTPEEPGKDSGIRKKILILTIGLVSVTCIAVVLLGVTLWAVGSKSGSMSRPLGFVQASAAISSNMDADANPCQDFAQYACGGWMKKNIIPDDSDTVSNFLKLKDDTEIILYNLLTSSMKSVAKKEEYLTKVLDYYKSCMDTTAMDSATTDSMKETVQSILEASDESEAIKLVTKYDISVFFVLYVDADNQNPTTNAIYMIQGALGMRLKEHYKDAEKHDYYMKYVKGLWDNYADSNIVSDDVVDNIDKFESCVAEVMKSPAEERSLFQSMPSKLYSEVKAEDFESKLHIGDQFSSRMTSSDDLDGNVVVYYHESYVSGTADCVKEHLSDIEDLKKYVATRFMLYYAEVAKESWRDLAWNYTQQLTKISVKPARWKTCIQTVTAYMPESVGRIFIEENFKEEAKEKTLDMISDIKAAFREILPSLDWMDDVTRKAAIEKADLVGNKIGYQDWLLDNAKLNERVSMMEMEKTQLLPNTMSGDRALATRNFNSAGKAVDKGKWYMSPATVNAYYSPKGNEMVFPAAILQPPFYHMDYPKYVNYGAMGVVIGHELTHGFDDQGRQYDKYGNLKSWYTKESTEKFQKRALCLVNQYSSYEIMGNQVNGNLTLGENMADNGGVKQSYIAYQNWIDRNGEEEPLPGLNLSNEQAFFISYAQIWCQKKTDEAYERMTKTDTHSPGIFRVKGAMVNSKEFAKAFNCKLGDNMNPRDKCEVW